MKTGNVKASILLVDDDEIVRNCIADFLLMYGHKVTEAPCAAVALELAATNPFDMVITDLKMPGMDGIDLLLELRRRNPSLVGVVMTGYGTVEYAVKAMKAGAFDFLLKPMDLNNVEMVIERAVGYVGLKKENEALKKELSAACVSGVMLGYSAPMQGVACIIKKVADTDATVLITGESGTGKEVAARALHNGSGRAKRPLVAINCGAIPEELLESELFGHEKGAFSGATHARVGRFELAHGGTLLLDEVSDMSPKLQAKLLRALQEREFERVGGETTIKVDVRVLAATRHNLEKLVEEGAFRRDLYYRLNVIQMTIPSLRERLDDLPVLAEFFVEKHGRKKGRAINGISDEVMDTFGSYPWPGNVRELENTLERACILRGQGIITKADLPDSITNDGISGISCRFRLPKSGIDFNETVDNFERELITQALDRSGGVKNRAAKLLGLGRTTLVEKMKRKNLFPGD